MRDFRGDRERPWWDDETEIEREPAPERVPGKRTRTGMLYDDATYDADPRTGTPGKRTLAELRANRPRASAYASAYAQAPTAVQMRGQRGVAGVSDVRSVQSIAARVAEQPGEPLPYREVLQRAFGPDVDLSSIRVHTGSAAEEACDTIGAE